MHSVSKDGVLPCEKGWLRWAAFRGGPDGCGRGVSTPFSEGASRPRGTNPGDQATWRALRRSGSGDADGRPGKGPVRAATGENRILDGDGGDALPGAVGEVFMRRTPSTPPT